MIKDMNLWLVNELCFHVKHMFSCDLSHGKLESSKYTKDFPFLVDRFGICWTENICNEISFWDSFTRLRVHRIEYTLVW